jgi:hypothetical protein
MRTQVPAKIALHVGAHKTGTSLIQKYMRDKPEQLAPFGIRAISRGDTNTLIGWGKPLIEQPELLTDRLDSEAATPGTRFVIASHENTLGRPHRPSGDHLYPEAEQRVAVLANILRTRDARVIMYLQPQPAFLESYYLQLVQQGETFTFDQWLDRVDFERVSWRPVVELLRDRVGRDRVAIGDFEEIRAGQDSFLTGFFQRVDPAITVEPHYSAKRNLSISDKGLRIALAANPHLRSAEEKKQMRDFLQKHFSNAKYPRPVLFSAEQRAELDARYGEEYRSLITS